MLSILSFNFAIFVKSQCLNRGLCLKLLKVSTRFFPKFTNYIGNLLEDSFLNKFSFFSSGFIVLFEKEKI